LNAIAFVARAAVCFPHSSCCQYALEISWQLVIASASASVIANVIVTVLAAA
jgi:hypothetical protein